MKHFNNTTASYQSRYPNIEMEVAGGQQAFGASNTTQIKFGTTFRLLSDWIYNLVVGLFSMINNVFEIIVSLLKHTRLLPYFRFAMLAAFLYVAFYSNTEGEVLHSSSMVTSTLNNSPNFKSSFAASINGKKPKKKQDPFAMAYIERFSKVAQTEMDKFGIPASIKLAQGLLETSNGKSRLAAENYNHFGLKCFSKSCKKGHCSNHSDDTHKDFFRKYRSAWESWRDHSQLLSGPRYVHLKEYGTNYKKWAKGLKKAGYATDTKYDKKLITIIELYQLDRFDR